MKQKENSKITLWQALRLHLRALRILYRYIPQAVLSRIALTGWESLTPYAGIGLSAMILDELAGNRDPARLLLLVSLTLGSAAVIALVSAFLIRWQKLSNADRQSRYRWIFADKTSKMDFEAVENTKTQTLYRKVEQNEFNSDWGLIIVLNYFIDASVKAICTVVGALAMTVGVFMHRIPDATGVLALLDHPACFLLIFAVMLLLSWLTSVLREKHSSYWSRAADDETLAARLRSFYVKQCAHTHYAADVRIYRQNRFAARHNDSKTTMFASHGWYARMARGSLGLVYTALGASSVIFTGVAYLYVCLKAWAGAFGVGAVTQYVAAITKLSGGISSFGSIIGNMRGNAPFLVSVFEYLDIPNRMYQGSLPVEKRRDNEYEFAFHNVSFKYPGSDNYALKNVSFNFKIGSRLAVVGMNGSGKTTMIKLLCRLYDPTEGTITLNGIDIRKYDYLEYLSVFSVVFQDFQLFAYRLGENVAGCADYDADRVWECLEKAGFGERLASLPKGMDTYLYKNFDKEGVEISGGEAQKIALARALYKDAPFVILDEPTAALDPIAEAEIYSRFNDIVRDKTTIYISHRLSSCRFCDEIVVFDHGEVVQQGSHEALVAKDGKYAELWNAQAQYYV